MSEVYSNELPSSVLPITKYTPLSLRQEKPYAILWLLKRYPSELSSSQIAKLTGSTKNTVEAISNGTYREAVLETKSPMDIGLCTYKDLEKSLNSRRKIIKEINLPNKQKSIIYEMKTYMHDLFIKQDKMTMAHSIENRVPFLDNDLVEFSLTYLANSNFDYSYFRNINKKTKKYLKLISSKYFGKSFSYRTKSGFSFPLKKILKSNDFRKPVENEIIPKIKVNDLYDLNNIIEIWENIDKASNSELELIFSIISFEIWLIKFKVNIK